jgi:hypothetical protein
MMDAVEARERRKETPWQRLVRESASLGAALVRLFLLAAILTPILLLSFLTLDLPLYGFDRLFDIAALKPSNWLTIGVLVMALATPVAILAARKFGGEEASRAVTASWGLAALATFIELAQLAPGLEDKDLPSVRFTVTFVASAMLGQYFAVAIYDVIRGGGPWWRAPLISALMGYGMTALIYYPFAHVGAGAPWWNWMVSDYAVKALVAFAFLPVYWLLQKPLRPVGGYGGR